MDQQKIKQDEQKDFNVFQLYLDEISQIKACDEAENEVLLNRLAGGDVAVLSRLIEGNLKYVLGLTRSYLTQGVAAGDLVQEANMALILAVNDWKEQEKETTDPAAFLRFVEQEVKAALKQAVEEESSEEKVEEKLLARVNVLKDLSTEMAEELGREATVEELAERLSMTADEVKDIMKLTLEAMSVHGEEYETV